MSGHQACSKRARPCTDRATVPVANIGLRRCRATWTRKGDRMAQVAAATGGGRVEVVSDKRVVICGAGIIGACTAYYLAKENIAATIVERCEVAAAASGKAGGFLALDWNDGSPLGWLARESYALHALLADELRREHGEDVGYRTVHTLRVSASPKAPRKHARVADLPDWLDGNVQAAATLGGPDTTAQVNPALLTRALVRAACARGARLQQGNVTGLQLAEGPRRVTGVVVDGAVLAADAVVVALGPWTTALAADLGLPPIEGQKYHSVVLRPRRAVSDHMLFTTIKTADGRVVEPEVYPRPDGTVYACGEAGTPPLPPDASQVGPDPGLAARLRSTVALVSSSLAEAEVEAEQACYLPLSPDGLPLVGAVAGVVGAYVGTGHGCWGILNGPATGRALAHLIAHGSVHGPPLAPFSPARFARQRAVA